MINNVFRKNIKVKIIALVFIFLFGTFLPINQAVNIKNIKVIDKGPSYRPIIPLKRTTFVNFDKNSYLDDYAYLASIPACVFSNDEKIYNSPLLFFQPDDTYPDEEKYLYLNDYQGTHYLMEDWMGYCNGQLDKLITVNVDKNELESGWRSKELIEIKGDDPFGIASEITLNEWSYSDAAIIAVIEEEFEKPTDTRVTGKVSGKISGEVGTDKIIVKRPYGSAPEYEYFTVEEEYKYIRADLWYPAFVMKSKVLNSISGFAGAIGVTFPSVDPDLQLYCKYEGDWLQTSAASDMAITGGPHEKCFTYNYIPGEWRVGVTNMPTEGGEEYFIRPGPLGKIITFGSFKEALRSLIFGVKSYYVDITKYPGVEVEIPDVPPYGCRDATIKLNWDNKDVNLGLTVIGPNGEELDSVIEEDKEKEIHFHQLGECLPDEHYKVVTYCLDDVSSPIDFTIEYTWQQNITHKEGDLIASACQGAIIGSIKNNPLLYVKPDAVPQCTIDALYRLGVQDLYIIDLGGYLSDEAKKTLLNIANIREHYKDYKNIYYEIMKLTGSNDVVFTTIDPWSYWYYMNPYEELGPDGEYKGAFHFAPAAYAAANHGCPLLIVDNHPELSGAVTWHVAFWEKWSCKPSVTPPIACMYFTGTKVKEFLIEMGFDKEGHESILTVADQYDIGPTWSRMFAGVANPGAIIGTPVDITNHISRCIFYPCLIFQNPALQGKVELINGSKSVRVQREFLHPLQVALSRLSTKTIGLSNLKIIRESGPEEFQYPVLHTYGCYAHRFNERGVNYWGSYYQTRRGYTPGVDLSTEEIDMGARLKYEGKAGAFLPDMTDSEIGPFYAAKAGYSSVFSTDFDITMENLNKGVISWYLAYHGGANGGGILSWWAPSGSEILPLDVITGSYPYEKNPWRCYDMWWGSTEEPDSACLQSEVGLLAGWLGIGKPGGNLISGGILRTGLDLVPTNIPLLKVLGRRDNYFDGMVGAYGITAFVTKFRWSHPATEIDDKLENLHSMTWHASSCQIGTRYLQIALMRHGSVLQEADPWGTSYYSSFALEQVPRDCALGKTAGETYSEGITEIGIQYVFEKDEPRVWWWDEKENIVLFTDPDLRVWVPSTEWDDQERNHWEPKDVQPLRYDEELFLDGHMPFGVTSYPHEKEPTTFWQQYIWIIIAAVIVIIIAIVTFINSRMKRFKK